MDPEIIETELVKANMTDMVVAKMRQDYMPLKVKDIYDKPGFAAVKAAMKEARDFRTGVVALLKEVRQPALDFQKRVVAREKEIVEAVKEIESHLKLQADIFDAGRAAPEIVKTPEETDTDAVRTLRDAIIAIPMPTVTTPDAVRVVEGIRAKLTEAILIK